MSMEYDYDEYEELDPQPFRRWRWVLVLISIPVVFLFIYIPLSSLPQYVTFAPLVKYSTLEHNKDYTRMILIGDVHGCYDELVSLLDAANYTSTDRVVLLGDFISKGPASLDVLDFAINKSFDAVLGNHEVTILAKYQNSRPVLFEDGETYALDRPGNIKTDPETRLARHLTPDHIDYLTQLPLVLNLGKVPGGKGFAVHVGMSLEKSVKKQSLNEQLSMDRDWYKDYNSEMKSLPKSDRNVVYYGHNAKYGLNLNKYTKGLDSACVKGGQLSALVLSNGKEKLVQVDCPEYISS
ncbi:Bis(5'-nucleosyl)-tetraphosphatase, symmetrical [Cyberlindnera fabianii]|uniref:Bis(5'-nucleosyl)-tetraphosphatase, symmetrical n=1 Tax=Cyberlindnera fabianii TaxID=36022 RepID=A0A1V2LB70_CYBFA|nr:Bis(5'-nucleosyl)-tetraphosphatase, symmetrical [Cyberlindnera fabianii]